jgi:hypothetical protein
MGLVRYRIVSGKKDKESVNEIRGYKPDAAIKDDNGKSQIVISGCKGKVVTPSTGSNVMPPSSSHVKGR